MAILTEQYVFACLEQEREGVQFPVDLDEAWESAGYSRKDPAVRKLTKSRLKEGVDYTFHQSVGTRRGGAFDKYFLTVDAYKSFLLAANTDEGEEARRYFISIEKNIAKILIICFHVVLS